MDIAARLAEARKNSGLTQAQVAGKLYLTTQAVSAWECGSTLPDTQKISEIAALYGVSTDWLLTGRAPCAEVLEITANLTDRLFDEGRMATYIAATCNAKQLYQTSRALAFAKEKHRGQYRRLGHGPDRVPYIYHPLLLTCHALALGLEEDALLSACLLHDVCEDCGVQPEALPVDAQTKEAVIRLSKPEGFDKSERAYAAYYAGIAENRIATMVKLLDRCNNVSSMATSFTDAQLATYIKETQEYIHPLMECARRAYPQYANALFLIRYHMNSVQEALRHHMCACL